MSGGIAQSSQIKNIFSPLTLYPIFYSVGCARQPVPGPPGTVTFIVSYEVHISTRIEQPKLCLHIRDAGLEKAAANLHYTNSHPAIAFPCTCSQEELHPATVSDDKTSRLYSIGDDKQDKLDETQLMWISLKCGKLD